MAAPSPHLPAGVGPGAKLEVAVLVVEGEPGDVNLAGRLEDSRRNIEHGTVFGDNDVCLEGSIKALISTVVV